MSGSEVDVKMDVLSERDDATTINDTNGTLSAEQRTMDCDAGDSRDTCVASTANRIIARMPTSRQSHYYNMDHKKRGLALIFNHEHFEIPDLDPRPGTNVDCNYLKGVLEGLGFEVNVFQDLAWKELFAHITHAASSDHSDHDCIIVCVMSHGKLNKLYASDRSYKPERLWNNFTADKCPTLAGKPKMFFIQACQGAQLDGGILMVDPIETDNDDDPCLTTNRLPLRQQLPIDLNSTSYKIPICADILISYSTIQGYVSWRIPTKGSWFIQALAEELDKHGKNMDLLTLLTFVSQRVAYDCESWDKFRIMHQQKQIPCMTSMLTRLVVFGDKK